MSPIQESAGALAAAVREIEAHAARSGWDQPAQLFALVETADLAQREPHLAQVLGLGATDPEDPRPFGLTPVAQEPSDDSLDRLLGSIVWPLEVVGCAVVVEALTLPPDAEVPAEAEADAQQAAQQLAEYAATDPRRQEARIVAGALRGGEGYCAIRQRAHDKDEMVLVGPDLVPTLLELLHITLQPDLGDPPDHE